MRKYTAFFLVIVLMFALAGCKKVVEQDSYRTDTVIYIPADPTEPEIEAETTEATTETIEETEATEEMVPETTKAATTKKPSSSSAKKPSSSPTTATTAPTEVTTEATMEATTAPPETEPPLYDISGYVVGGLEIAMMDEINNCRTAEGLGELSKNSRLCAIASARAYEACQHWSHTRPDGRGFATVFGDYGFGCSSSAENLIYTTGNEDAATLIAKWMGTDANRNHLMNGGFTTIGIGIYQADGYASIACLLAG